MKVLVICAAVVLRVSATSYVGARDLTFEDRVKAQEAIERVYYSHQLGATKAFEEAVPRSLLEAKVHKYFDETAVLRMYWKTAVTDETLQRELERMAQGTRMPERLQELYAALNNDPFLVKECLARPALVDRLAHNFYAFDPTLHAQARAQAESLHRQLAAGEMSPSAEHPNRTVSDLVVNVTDPGPSKTDTPAQQRLTLEEFQKSRAELPARIGQVSDVSDNAEAFVFRTVVSETATEVRVASYVARKTSWDAWWSEARVKASGEALTAVASGSGKLPTINASASLCAADDTWVNGSLGDAHVSDPRRNHTAVWTGTLMVIWGGSVGAARLNSGGRYDPATDSWTPTSMTGAPAARNYHSAIWTGSRMVIWGGYSSGGYFNSGGLYDPVGDSWMPTSVAGVPSARLYHTAVWTGQSMVVWGGYDVFNNSLNTGGRYNPTSDSWSPTTTSGAPTPRYHHTAVWTGSRMVIWGGANLVNNGGRYDPVTDAWTTVSMNAAPTARYHHSAAWTGNSMLVWGGTTTSNPVEIETNTGGRYDPAIDTWTSMSSTNAPSPRAGHGAIWTGDQMVIWGGYEAGNYYLDSGARYDPATDLWSPMSTASAPTGRAYQTTIWTGALMVVWGGVNNASEVAAGGRYHPSTDTWTPVSTEGRPAPREYHPAVWTGSLMIVWGGFDNYTPWLNSGGRYDPATDSWTPTSMTGAPTARYGHTAVWTGSRMVIWGGYPYANTGGRYDPIADAWAPTSTIGAPSARYQQTAVWTGSLMVVWGGIGFVQDNSGGRYDPATDSWTPTSTNGAPSARAYQTAIWTGNRMVVWGGQDSSYNLTNTGARYDTVTDSWAQTSVTGAPTARYFHTTLWSGNFMLVWGGVDINGRVNTGGRYDPATDLWTPNSTLGAPAVRSSHSAVWTGSVMVVWGGYNSSGNFHNSGGRYDLATDSWLPTTVLDAPPARANHSAVWTGSLMLVWGGFGNTNALGSGGRYLLGASVDNDGDGYSECQGDCNDGDPTIYPGGPQLCDGKNNDCNDPTWPAVLANEADADRDGFGICQGDCDDNDASVYPGAPQLCDGNNNDCSNAAWPAVPANEADADDDGYRICDGDCDETRASVHPGATETCNGVDDNCDGTIDNSGNALCDDGNPCTDDRCDGAAGCAHTNNTSACDDGNACTTGDTCLGGSCMPGAGSLVCNDGNVCTTDSCNPATGCVFTNNTIACDDGIACTFGDTCGGGSCNGTAIVCNDNNTCTDDSCNTASGVCVFTNDDTNTCTDGNPCTQTDACHAGSCSGSNPVQCNGGCPPGFSQVGGLCQKTYDIGVDLLDNLSTYCDGTGTNRYNNCGYLNYGFHWTDLGSGLAAITRVDVQLEAGINCGGTSSSVKLNGVPVGGFNLVGSCGCSSTHGTIAMSNLAVGAYVITGVNAISVTPSGNCEGLSKSANLGNSFARVTVTYAPFSNACQAGTCDPATGACNYSNLAEGTTCSDDNACTSGDSCVGGACQSGAPLPVPPEVQNLTAAADKASYIWSAAAGAVNYDVVRGSTGALPVGPGGGDEVCFDNLADATLNDPAIPTVGSGFWYLSRGESACGVGTFGTRSDGAPRTTTTCP